MSKISTERSTGNELLRQYVATHTVPVARTAEELYRHSVRDDDGEEVDGFVKLLDEWRHNEFDLDRRID